MTIIDEACWERGCPCHDDGESAGVEVIRKEWVGLTDEEVGGLTVFSNGLHDVEVPILADLIRAVGAKLKEKNT